MKRYCVITAFVWLTAITALFPVDGFAQADLYRVETTEGNVFIGHVVSEDDERIILNIESIGEVSIRRINIRSMTRVDPQRMRDGVYWHTNPQATRYFFAPNAIGLEKGTGYYQNTWIFFNNVNYGISDNISLGGGLVPMFLFGVSGTPVWLLPKVTIPVAADQFHLGAGAMLGGVVGIDSELLGLFYGVATLGDRDRNLTVGLGYGYAGREISSTPLINVSGMVRTSRRLYLLSENYFIPGAEFSGIVSFGARWTAENFAVDFGLFRPLEDAGGLIGVPWLGVTIPFGR